MLTATRFLKRLFIFCTSLTLSSAAWAQWSYVGTNISFNNTYPANYSFAIDKTDTLYVAFADMANQYIVTVKKLVGNTWTAVGTPGFITGVGNSSGLFYHPGIALAINPADNTPYIALADGDHDNKVSVMRFNGTQWVYVGTPGFSLPDACGVKLAFTPAGSLFVAYSDCYNGGGLSAMRYFAGSWVAAGASGFATGNYLQLTALPDNTLAVAFQDQAANNKLSVMKYNGVNWVYQGAPGLSDGDAQHISIAADPAGALYVSYSDYLHNDKITVQKFGNGLWSPLGAPSFSNFTAQYTHLTISRYGEPYVSYVEGSFPVVKKFKNGGWSGLGNYVATTTCQFTSILTDSVGTPYVLMALQPSATLPFVARYKFCNDTDYHFVATALLDSAITYTNDSTTLKVAATGGQPPYKGTGTFKVAAGYYTYTVTDRNRCTATVTINVPAPCTQNYWTGNVSTAWEDAGNWSCGTVPTAFTAVYVEEGWARYPVIHSGVTCKQLYVATGTTVTVATGGHLNIADH